jgi:hypothetical protein
VIFLSSFQRWNTLLYGLGRQCFWPPRPAVKMNDIGLLLDNEALGEVLKDPVKIHEAKEVVLFV